MTGLLLHKPSGYAVRLIGLSHAKIAEVAVASGDHAGTRFSCLVGDLETIEK